MNIINVVCGSAGSAELTLHHIFTSSKAFNSGKFGPGKSEKHNQIGMALVKFAG